MLKTLRLGVVVLSLVAIPISVGADGFIDDIYPYSVWIAGHRQVSDDGQHLVMDCDGTGDWWCITVPEVGICSSGIPALEGYQGQSNNYYFFRGTQIDSTILNDDTGAEAMQYLKDTLNTYLDSLLIMTGYCD